MACGNVRDQRSHAEHFQLIAQSVSVVREPPDPGSNTERVCSCDVGTVEVAMPEMSRCDSPSNPSEKVAVRPRLLQLLERPAASRSLVVRDAGDVYTRRAVVSEKYVELTRARHRLRLHEMDGLLRPP